MVTTHETHRHVLAVLMVPDTAVACSHEVDLRRHSRVAIGAVDVEDEASERVRSAARSSDHCSHHIDPRFINLCRLGYGPITSMPP